MCGLRVEQGPSPLGEVELPRREVGPLPEDAVCPLPRPQGPDAGKGLVELRATVICRPPFGLTRTTFAL